MGQDFSQVTHRQLGEEGDAQAGDPRKEVSSQSSLLPPALFISFPLASPPLCLAPEMKIYFHNATCYLHIMYSSLFITYACGFPQMICMV